MPPIPPIWGNLSKQLLKWRSPTTPFRKVMNEKTLAEASILESFATANGVADTSTFCPANAVDALDVVPWRRTKKTGKTDEGCGLLSFTWTSRISWNWVVLSNIFYFLPLSNWRWSNLTNIFQVGWFNHQLVKCCVILRSDSITLTLKPPQIFI